jgi:hypothetical protein
MNKTINDIIREVEEGEGEVMDNCLCELCGCGANAQYGHLCAYCDNAHPEYHKHDCDKCGEEGDDE